MELNVDKLFNKTQRRHPGILRDLWQILVDAKSISPEKGLTLSKIREAYYELTDERFPTLGEPRVELLFLLLIPYVACCPNKNGTYHFYLVPPETPYSFRKNEFNKFDIYGYDSD